MLKIYLFSLFTYGSLFMSASKANEGVLGQECAKKAAGVNYQIIKNIMDEHAGNDDIGNKDKCGYRLSEDKNTASYLCGDLSESFFINCNTKSPKVGILNTNPYINRNDNWDVKDCFKKAGVDVDKIKGTNCIVQSHII